MDAFTEGPILGAVVGNTNTVGAFWEPRGRNADILTNARGNRITPSVAIHYAPLGSRQATVFVGEDAIAKEKKQPGGLIQNLRMYVGLNSRELDLEALGRTAPKLVPDRTNTRLMLKTRIGLDPGEVPVEQLSSLLVKSLQDRLATQLPSDIGSMRQVVVAAPPYYSMSQRESLRRVILTLDGVSLCGVVSEPLAALVGSGILGDTNVRGSGQSVVVADIGGTSTCLSLLKEAATQQESPKGVQCFQCVGVAADLECGATSVNQEILADLGDAFKQKCGQNMNEKNLKKVAPEVERLKCDGKGGIDVDLPDADSDSEEGEFEYTMDGQKMKRFCARILKVIKRLTTSILKSTGTKAADVTHVVLCGGGARLHAVEEYFQEAFQEADILGGARHAPEQTPDYIVALGCAKLGAFAATLPDSVKPCLRELEANPHLVFYAADAVGEGIAVSSNVTLASVEKGKTAAAIALEVASGTRDILVKKDTPLPVSVMRHFGCATPFAMVHLVEMADIEDPLYATPLGSVCLRLPTRIAPSRADEGDPTPPTVAVRVTVTPHGCVEVQALVTHPESSDLTVVSSLPLQAYTGNTQPMKPPVVPKIKETPQTQPQPQAQAPAEPPRAATPTQPPPAAPLESPREKARIDIYDRFQALAWFFQDMKSFNGMYAVSQADEKVVENAMLEANRASQAEYPTVEPALAALEKLNRDCSMTVGKPPHSGVLIELALGLWQFAVAPQGDEVALLMQAFAMKTPAEHRTNDSGETLLHSV